MQGKIIKGIAGFYYVYGEDDVLYECKAKGIFRKDNQKPLVGDNVEITILDEAERTVCKAGKTADRICTVEDKHQLMQSVNTIIFWNKIYFSNQQR